MMLDRVGGIVEAVRKAIPRMTQTEHQAYESAGFFGREDIVARIIDVLRDPQADQLRQRAVLVEGPAGRGKTWLLCRIHEQLQSDVAVCFFKGTDFAPRHIEWSEQAIEELTRQLLARLLDVVHAYCPTLPWPRDTAHDTDTERLAKIVQLLGQWQPQNLLQLISATIDADKLPILLIILDGMEEIEAEILKIFEFKFVHELFRNPRVRLLASRRIKSITHQWKRPLIKQQKKDIVLDMFDSPEDQIAYLFQTKGATEAPSVEFKQQMTTYTWFNPGANAQLVGCAMANNNLITHDCIRACLIELMQSVRDPSSITAIEFEYIYRMATQFADIDTVGVARHLLNSVFDDVNDKKRDEFLGYLQSRGIGFFGESGSYILHSDFVQLFRELHSRKSV